MINCQGSNFLLVIQQLLRLWVKYPPFMIPENLLPSSRKSIFLGHVNSAHFVTSYLFVSQYIITKQYIKYYVSPRFPNDGTNLRVHQPGISYNVIYVLFLDNLYLKFNSIIPRDCFYKSVFLHQCVFYVCFKFVRGLEL